MMRSFKKIKSDLGNGSHYVTGANADGVPMENTDGVPMENTDGVPEGNPDGTENPGESTDSSGTFNWDDFEDDVGAIHLDLDKVAAIPGNFKESEAQTTAELVRKHQWMHSWHLADEDITYTHAHNHLKHTIRGMESEELKAHLKTTGLLIKGVKSEISKITGKVDGIKENVDTSLGKMITKSQAATIIGNQQDLQKSQQLLQAKMEAMESKFDLLLSFLLPDDAKKGEKEKALLTKCGPELKAFSDDREGGGAGGSGKDKAVGKESTAAVQQRTAAGSSKEAGGSSSGQGQSSKQILMDSTLMLDPDTISKKFTQEIEIGGVTERVFYRDPRLQQADEELARLLNLEINPDYNLEESLKEQRRLERKKISKVPRGRGGRRGRGRTHSKSTRPIEKGISIREPVEQPRSSLISQPSESVDRKGKGILLEEPKKSKKNSSSNQIPESIQSTPSEEEKKRIDEVVESKPQVKPEGSNPDEGTRSNPDGVSTSIPEESNPDGGLIANPDEPNPDGGTSAIPDGGIIVNPDAIDSEEINPEQTDEGKEASKLKKYVYLNEMISREKIREDVKEALRRYIYNIKKFKDRWRKPIPADKDVDRRRHFPPRPRSDSKFTPDYKMIVKFIPESGVDQGQQEQRKYRYSWAEMADRVLAVQEDFKTFGLGHPDFQKNSRLPQLRDSAPLTRRIDESLSQEHLDRLMSVSLIIDQMDGNKDKEKMIYFLEDGLNYKINEIELMQKNWKELEHVLFLFKEKNSVCSRWKSRMIATAALQKKCIQVNEDFKPKYLNAHGEEVEMKKGDAKLETFLGKIMLSFNPESIKGCAIDIGSGMH